MADPTSPSAGHDIGLESLRRWLDSRRQPKPDNASSAAAKAGDRKESDKDWLPKCFPGCGCGEQQSE